MYSLRRRLPPLTSALAVAVVAFAYGASSSISTAGASSAKKAPSHTLTGTWSGKYGGKFNGSFTLKWKQSGSKLTGTIKLSNPSSTLTVHGSVTKDSIRFGTVGSAAITYTGSVSKSSMSGNYNTPAGGGSWSAHKT